MGKSKRRNGNSPLVMIKKNTLQSDAWKQLTHPEKVGYIHLKANFNGSNNGEISFKYSSMQGVMAPATLSKALKGLEKKGWIEKTEHGGLCRYYCLYRLTGKYDGIRNEKGRGR